MISASCDHVIDDKVADDQSADVYTHRSGGFKKLFIFFFLFFLNLIKLNETKETEVNSNFFLE